MRVGTQASGSDSIQFGSSFHSPCFTLGDTAIFLKNVFGNTLDTAPSTAMPNDLLNFETDTFYRLTQASPWDRVVIKAVLTNRPNDLQRLMQTPYGHFWKQFYQSLPPDLQRGMRNNLIKKLIAPYLSIAALRSGNGKLCPTDITAACYKGLGTDHFWVPAPSLVELAREQAAHSPAVQKRLGEIPAKANKTDRFIDSTRAIQWADVFLDRQLSDNPDNQAASLPSKEFIQKFLDASYGQNAPQATLNDFLQKLTLGPPKVKQHRQDTPRSRFGGVPSPEPMGPLRLLTAKKNTPPD